MSAIQRITTNPKHIAFGKITEISSETNVAIPGVRKIRADDLQIDHGYQRPLSPSAVDRIAKEFDPQLFGIVLASERPDGSLWLLDGQQRIGAIRKLGKGDTLVPCEVLTGLSWAREAEIYDKRNKNRRPLTPQEKFKGALAWGDPDAVEAAHIVRANGFTINLETSERHDGRTPAVGALLYTLRQYRKGHLDNTLALIRATWGSDMGPRGALIDGVAYFVALYADTYHRSRFTQAVGRHSIEHVHREAGDYRRATGSDPKSSVCAVLVRCYNTKVREENRLPEIGEMRALRAMKEAQGGR